MKLKMHSKRDIIRDCIEAYNEHKMACCFDSLFGEDFIYNDKIIYHFNGVFWEKTETALMWVYAHQYIKLFTEYQGSLLDQMRKCSPTDPEYKNLHKQSDDASKLIKMCLSHKSITNVCKLILLEIYKPDMEFEQNPDLFVFRNKVFNLEEGQFVEPNKFDYMSMSTRYDYREPTKEEIESLGMTISKIHPDESDRRLYLSILATSLQGQHIEKFTMANGSGGNGKGVLNELALRMMGDYGYTCSNAVLLGPLKSGANVEVSNMHQRRLIIYREPDTGSNSTLNCATIKELTGGSEVNSRGLYSSDTRTQLRATHILECNKRPKMTDSADNGIGRRLIDIHFKSLFVKDESMVNHDAFIYMGDDYTKSIAFQEKHKFALFHILAGHWKDFKASGKNIDALIPTWITERSSDYLKSSSETYTWILENYEQTKTDTDVVKLADMHESFMGSTVYLNYTKKEKREFGKKAFIEMVEGNKFLRPYYKEVEYRKIVLEDLGAKHAVRNVLFGFVKRDAVE